MYGSFGRTQDGQDYWIGYGKDAVRMCRECIAKARATGDAGLLAAWRWREQEHLADPSKTLRCNLPLGAVRYERHSRGMFGPKADRMFDEQR